MTLSIFMTLHSLYKVSLTKGTNGHNMEHISSGMELSFPQPWNIFQQVTYEKKIPWWNTSFSLICFWWNEFLQNLFHTKFVPVEPFSQEHFWGVHKCQKIFSKFLLFNCSIKRKDMNVNEHERLSNITLRHKLKQRNSL